MVPADAYVSLCPVSGDVLNVDGDRFARAKHNGTEQNASGKDATSVLHWLPAVHDRTLLHTTGRKC